jgi:hypothetical protein
MSIHDEFERAVSGRRKRLHPLAWIAIAFAGIAFVGMAVVAVTGVFVAREVRDVVEDFKESPVVTIAERAIEASPNLELVSVDRAKETVTFRNVKDDRVRTVDAQDFVEGRFTIRTDDGDVTIDLEAGEHGGTLVVTTGDGEVVRLDASGGDGTARLVVTTPDGEAFRLDATGDDDGGSLIIRTDEDRVRFDAVGGEDHGTLSIRTDAGELVRFEVDGADDQGSLTIHTANGSTTLRGLTEGGEVPGWVPLLRDADVERVYTAEADEGIAGAVRLTVQDSPRRVLRRYRESLEDGGYSIESQDLSVQSRQIQGTVIGERGDRTIMIIAVGGDSRSHLIVTYADRN